MFKMSSHSNQLSHRDSQQQNQHQPQGKSETEQTLQSTQETTPSSICKPSSFVFTEAPSLTDKSSQYKDLCPASKQSESQHKQGEFNTIIFNKTKQDNLLDLTADGRKAHVLQSQSKAAYLNFLDERILDIQGPELINEGLMTSYKLYRIRSRKRKQGQKEEDKQRNSQQDWDTSVSRRFSDFEYLQKRLIDNYGGHIIPLLPQKNFWTSLNLEGKDYADLRKKYLLKYVTSLISHPKLKITQQIRTFLFVDDQLFSEMKGQYVSTVRTEDKVRLIAFNAFEYGKQFLSKFMQKKTTVTIINPTKDDLILTEYELLVNQLSRAIKLLRKMVQNTANEIRLISGIRKNLKDIDEKEQIQQGKGDNLDQHASILLQEFEDLGKFIESCSEALIRRQQVRLALDGLHKEERSLAKKLKSNPRSHQIDLLRSKITKANIQCQNWTATLIQELSKSVSQGKSMLENFIKRYEEVKLRIYKTPEEKE